MVAPDVLAALINDDLLPSRMPDVELLLSRTAVDTPRGNPICLSFGETWSEVAPGLAEKLVTSPLPAHGYQLSMYGLPALRQLVRSQIQRDHRLSDQCEPGRDFEVAITWTGTRSAMFDFGRMIQDDLVDDGRQPVVVAAGPSWDYEGVYGGLGFQVRYLNLSAESDFRPSSEELNELLAAIDRDPEVRLALVVLNPQHNPTAVNWQRDFVEDAVRAAIGYRAAILVDDAYFAMHNPGVVPTSALAVLLEELRNVGPEEKPRWLMVRSLGKQFNCNGWGVGAMVADPDLLDDLVNRYRLHHGLMYGGVFQHAMREWLADDESYRYLQRKNSALCDRRQIVNDFLTERLGYPKDQVHAGECTSYSLIKLPPGYAEAPDGPGRFRMDCFDATDVLLAPAWPWPAPPDAKRSLPYMRMFIGVPTEVLKEALDRIEEAGFHYTMAPRVSSTLDR